jgi:hypothetical protein
MTLWNDYDKHSPDWSALLDLWLQTHYKGQPAVVFCNPLEDPTNLTPRVELMRKLFGKIDHLVGAEYAILACSSRDEANRIMRDTPKEEPYTLVWDGSNITGHH